MTKPWCIFLLWLCPALFLSRVCGQILVGIYQPSFLPGWQEWYSGLLPYPWLLLSQLLLLMLMAVVNTNYASGQGWLYPETERARGWLRRAALIYAVGMVIRYVWRMVAVPEARWFGGTIPIWFHLVLAAWLALLSVRPKSVVPR
jgi:hypothetical protein